jgi:microcompartment protein CcmK/EutM
MYLARVTGRVVATRKYKGLEGVPLQWIQPLDERGAAMGPQLVACAAISSPAICALFDGRRPRSRARDVRAG